MSVFADGQVRDSAGLFVWYLIVGEIKIFKITINYPGFFCLLQSAECQVYTRQ